MARSDILERKEEVLKLIEEETPNCKIAEYLHCKVDTLKSYYKKWGIDYKGQQNKKGQKKGGPDYRPASYYIDNGLTITSYKLKEKLIKDGIKEPKCELCGASEWLGYPLPLELHHKDGNHFNNSLDNLVILCPNCHSIQEGNSGASTDKYKKMRP